MGANQKAVSAFDVITERFPEWWADPQTKDLRDGIAAVIPTNPTDAGLMVLGGPGGALARKIGVGLLASGAGEAEAGNLIPLLLTGLKKRIPEILEDVKSGLSRSGLFEKYGITAASPDVRDMYIHMPNKGSGAKMMADADKGVAQPLEAIYENDSLLKTVPSLKGLNTIWLPNSGNRIKAGADYTPVGQAYTLPKRLPATGSGLEHVRFYQQPSDLQSLEVFGVKSRAPGQVIDHELNHALAAKVGASESPANLQWKDSIHEIVASLGAQDVPTGQMIKDMDMVLPLNDTRFSGAVPSRFSIVGSPAQQRFALEHYNRKPSYAKGGSVTTTNILPSGEGDSELVKLWRKYKPELTAYVNDLNSKAGEHTALLGRSAKEGAKGGPATQELLAQLADAYNPSALGVIKAPGGNWLAGSVEGSMSGLKRHKNPDESLRLYADSVANPATTAETLAELSRRLPDWQRESSLNTWIDKQLTRYVKNDMATPGDPVRELAERGVLHVAPEDLNFRREMHGKYLAPGQTAVAKSDAAKTWEGASDMKVGTDLAGNWLDHPSLYSAGYEADRTEKLLADNSWLYKVPPETPVHAVSEAHLAPDLGFNHLIDELRNATNPTSGLPQDLLWKYSDLNKVSVPQAVERVSQINEWRAAQKVEADLARANNAAAVLHKEYPENNPQGFKWVELKQPELKANRAQELGEDADNPFAPPSSALDQEVSTKALADALKYEGDTMGNCVGGYCDKVMGGQSRVFSLRDKKGQPHVTIETLPGIKAREGAITADQLPPDVYESFKRRNVLDPSHMYVLDEKQGHYVPTLASTPDAIKQIKGSGKKDSAQRIRMANTGYADNPDAHLLPFVQDFVKSGKWSDVRDLEHAGLELARGQFNTNALKTLEEQGKAVPHYATRGEIEDLRSFYGTLPPEIRLGTPQRLGLELDKGIGDWIPEPGYAQGGPVSSAYNQSKVDDLINSFKAEFQ